MLDANNVLEVLELERDDSSATAQHRHWRNQALLAVNARSLLGLSQTELPARHMGVVYAAKFAPPQEGQAASNSNSSTHSSTHSAESHPPLMLEIDAVERLHGQQQRAAAPAGGIEASAVFV